VVIEKGYNEAINQTGENNYERSLQLLPPIIQLKSRLSGRCVGGSHREEAKISHSRVHQLSQGNQGISGANEAVRARSPG
jgi:hypothetical protein